MAVMKSVRSTSSCPLLPTAPTIQRYFKDHGYYTLSGGKVLHHNFGGRLSEDIDQSLGRARSPRPKKPMSSPGKLERSLGLGGIS